MHIDLFQDLASLIGVESTRPALAQALRQAEDEVRGDWSQVWPKRLEVIAPRVGLRATPVRNSIREIADLLRPGVVAMFSTKPTVKTAWVFLTAAGGGAVKLFDPEEHTRSRWLGESAFAELLGLRSDNDPVDCLLVEAALPCQPANTTSAVAAHAGALAQHGHSHEHAGHDSHAHGVHPGQDGLGGHHASLPPLRRLLQILKPDRSDIWAIFWYAVGISVLMLATPITIEALVSTVAFGSVLQPLIVLSLVLLGCLIFAAVLRGMQTYLVEILQRRIFVRVMADLAQRLPRVKIAEFDRHHGPELVNRFFDVLTVQKISATLLMDGITIVLQTTIGMLVVAFYHPILFSLDLVLIALIMFIIFGLGRGAINTAIRESICKYRVAEWLQELARNPVTFKMGGGADYALQRADGLAAEYLSARDRAFRIVFRQIIASLVMQAVASTALLSVGGWLVINGSLTLGQLIAAELILSAVVASFVKFGKHLESFYDLMAATDKLGHLIDLDLERSTGETLPNRGTGAALEAREVGFSFDSHSPVLSHFDLKLTPGERVALVTRGGKGKTTLTELLFGLRPPHHGQIIIDGVDYRDLRLGSLREQIAIVSRQEIFEGTIADNIRIGRDHLLLGDLRRVLADVGLLDDVMRMPDGLNTPLTTGGASLSSGQIQRLMIARAIAGRPRLLILDETLDSFPIGAAEELVKTLFDRSAPWTLLLITNRDEYLGQCDRVIGLGGDDSHSEELLPATDKHHH